MPAVTGRTGPVVIVGAGLAGLSCALHLLGAGREVTLLERAPAPGGLAGQAEAGGHRFDTGPTVLTAPGILERAFNAVGETTADRLDLLRLDPAYRGLFADGSSLDVLTDPAAMAAHVRAECGPRDAAAYVRYAAHLTELYRLQIGDFIDRNLDAPTDLLTAGLLRLAAAGGFGRLQPLVDRHFHDERLRRLFSFQALYAGLAPARALALYAVISYLDAVAGVHYPRGGMHRIPLAMAGAAAAAGADIRYRTAAERVVLRGDRAVAVRTADGETHPAGAVVLAVDPGIAAGLLDRPAPGRGRYSPSCVLLHLGGVRPPPRPAHHTIVFGRAWRDTFADVIDRGRVMRDPSLMVTCPGRTDPADAATAYVLAPAPNLRTGRIDWDARGPAYAAEILDLLRARDLPLSGAAVRRVTTPDDWRRAGHTAGTPFALAHTFAQTGPFRPATFVPGLPNVVRCGGAVQPGVGVPMVLLSGRLAAARLTGAA